MGIAGKLAKSFYKSKLTLLILLASLAVGVFSTIITPKEEDPQIVVPMIDIITPYPGATPKEVEKRITTPLENILWDIPGVKYIYSQSESGVSVVTVRFKVGFNTTKALVSLTTKMMANMNIAPPGLPMMPPLIREKSINDVPIVTLTLWGRGYDDIVLRKFAAIVKHETEKINNVSGVFITGGKKHKLMVYLDEKKLSANKISPFYIKRLIEAANFSTKSNFVENNKSYMVRIGRFIKNKNDLGNIVVGIHKGKLLYLKDVAAIKDFSNEHSSYTFMGFGQASKYRNLRDQPAVTVSIAKRKGTNAVLVANAIKKKIAMMRGTILPDNLHVTVTRNYGKTAQEKSNELILHLIIATIAVVLLVLVFMGIREAVVVLVTVPVTLSTALFVNYLYGFTLNRVTLFALIFVIGILVDGAIVVVENINRWMVEKKLSLAETIIGATDEVGGATILATFTVLAALMPMAFVGGLMGPYMKPMPINASVAMLFSLFFAFTAAPWTIWIIYHRKTGLGQLSEEEAEAASFSRKFKKFYRKFALGFFRSRTKRVVLYLSVLVLLAGSAYLIINKSVIVKMLPYDNKNEMDIVLNMPSGTTLEETANVARRIAHRIIKKQNEVVDYQIYVGEAAPFNFNGLVRHYYMRRGPVYAEIMVDMVGKHKRIATSHQIAKRIRPLIHKLADKLGVAYAAIVEIPPGPPVMSPLVAEIYGPNQAAIISFARKVKNIFKEEPMITDVGWQEREPDPEYRLTIDEDKAKLNGLTRKEIASAIWMNLSGLKVAVAKTADTESVPIIMKLNGNQRTSIKQILNTNIVNRKGFAIPLKELVKVENIGDYMPIYHKNLKRVVYVLGDTQGKEEAPFYGVLKIQNKILNIKNRYGKIGEYWLNLPFFENHFSVKWGGEMHITVQVFKDLGLAFLAAIMLMYFLIVGWFKDFRIPVVIMSPIPLTLIGIIPGHLIFGSFFTATSMIGFIALSGIILRNSILLVDFAESNQRELGKPLAASVIEAVSVRARPIIITALGVMISASVILFDPIFNGLAVSLIFGTFASTFLTLLIIPILYYAVRKKHPIETD
ncbi:MAG: efflux RND transporter permease subunit [Epsilonproteobacteria bacterium]|nr:efflux RND transporter permease subunit [Campylobacterota bacterium]